uniref:TTF-type domain-containing protein n=1 Tax=Lactuca sativa TaxID=4236 RepID=A0A9R1WG21_LACSA|nr:hypothetical protein LSAT_V11C200061230 [Lactuca sativa]
MGQGRRYQGRHRHGKIFNKEKTYGFIRDINADFSKHSHVKINLEDLPSDPGKRNRILDYDPNVRDEVRRAYFLKGPCQPKSHEFPYILFGKKTRRLNVAWFNVKEYSTWLEYSINQNDAYCLCCYLFKPYVGAQGGGETFVGMGFQNWAHKEKLTSHIGGFNSVHNQAWAKCKDLLNNKQCVDVAFAKHSTQSAIDYDIRLDASIGCISFLLRQGFAFRGHDESETSNNRGNFIELLQFLADHNQSIKVVTFNNAPSNMKLTSLDIQKDIVHAAAIETTKIIINDIEQMSVVLRYVDMEGRVIECFLGIEHVPNTTAITLKETLDNLFSRHGLSISSLRGQGYDGPLQLTLVAMAKNNSKIVSLFVLLTNVVNVVGGSCKRLDRLREQQASKVIDALGLDVLEIIAEDGATPEQKCEADMLINSLETFDFIFSLHFMKKLLGITNELSQALQRKHQDIVNAMNLVRICKMQMQNLRDIGWDSMLTQTTLFGEKHEIDVCNMDAMFLLRGRLGDA